jgi:hypothetical protein
MLKAFPSNLRILNNSATTQEKTFAEIQFYNTEN